MNVLVREYNCLDYYQLKVLLKKVYNSDISQEILEKNYISSNKSIIVAVLNDEILVGCSFVDNKYDYVRSFHYLYVSYVAVDEMYRRNGIGKRIFDYIIEMGKRLSCDYIELTSANYRKEAHDFYEYLGFTKKNTTVFIKELENI